MTDFYGPYGALAADNIERLASSQANAAWFHGFQPELFERCERAGVAANVEFRTFRDDLDAHPELRPIGIDGNPIRYGSLVQGVCLSQDAFIAEREESLRQGLSAYAPEGVWLDYLTYPGWFETPDPDLQESCFCPACVRTFNEDTGVDCTSPREILRRHDREWHEHKCARIEAFAHRFTGIIRTARPGTIVGLYACPWYPDEFNGALTRIFAQDFDRLAPIFDVITPLLYATKCGRPASWAAEYLAEAPRFIPGTAHLAPILDTLEFPENVDALAAWAERAGESAHSVPLTGFQLFAGDRVFSDPAQVTAFDRAVRILRRATGDDVT